MYKGVDRPYSVLYVARFSSSKAEWMWLVRPPNNKPILRRMWAIKCYYTTNLDERDFWCEISSLMQECRTKSKAAFDDSDKFCSKIYSFLYLLRHGSCFACSLRKYLFLSHFKGSWHLRASVLWQNSLTKESSIEYSDASNITWTLRRKQCHLNILLSALIHEHSFTSICLHCASKEDNMQPMKRLGEQKSVYSCPGGAI